MSDILREISNFLSEIQQSQTAFSCELDWLSSELALRRRNNERLFCCEFQESKDVEESKIQFLLVTLRNEVIELSYSF